ncbi:MAG: FHA domain-containing protein [Gammaproteobacteria bacterium]|nr:FHA domain-containing protein [Gammaproteobacteria bacterium]
MYLDLFNLQTHPFRLTPDAEFLYLSSQHARAKACIEQAGNRRDALVLITGEVGCGKSVLVNRVIAEMSDDVALARLTQTNLDPEEFLQSVLSQYGLAPFERDKNKLMGLLDNFLFAQNMRQRPVVLIVEEAQNLSGPVLDVVSTLAELEEDSEKLISVVLVGQPGLRDKLKSREFRKLASRVSATAHIEALSQAETMRLITHRLKVAGCDDSPFDDDVYADIYSYTGGVPRIIVNLCDTALTAAYVEDSPRVNREILKAAIEELELERVAESDPDLRLDEEQVKAPVSVHLSVTERGQPLDDFLVKDTRVLIGRDSDNDITLISEFISRHHAQIAMDQQGRFAIKDLNSTNGVYVNGVKTQRCILKNGDRIIMGYHQMVFHDAGESATNLSSAAEIDDWRETAVLSQGIDEADDQAGSA